MNRPMFPHTVDSTMLSAFRSCPQKMFRTYVEHWKPKSESVHLIAGGAFASGIEAARKAFYMEGQSPENSEAAGLEALLRHYGDFECPPESAKSPERTAGALEFYFQNYPLGADQATPVKLAGGKQGIEFSFAHPLEINHPVTGDPILYTGRADMIADFAGGIYVFDEKTASQLGPSWGRQWDLRSQFTGYCWACRQDGIQAAGVIVRGVSILKTKYDTQQAITYRAEWEVDRWHAQTLRDIERMLKCWKDGYWDFSLDHACAEYGGCSLTQVCKSQSPESWLDTYYEKRVWDPLARRQLSIQEWEDSWGHPVVPIIPLA